jgi:DNA polymerase V
MGENILGIKKTVKIGIIDCNNFYVSCERVFNPISVGKPTVVLSNNDGCVIARSQEAKKYGIKMGEPFFSKREFMEQKGFYIYSSNYNLYGDMSDRVMHVIRKYTNTIEVYSIDECFVDFSDTPDDELEDKMNQIRDEVKRQVGIPVSIGVGPNKTLAKLTSYLAKKTISYSGVCSYWSSKEFQKKLLDVKIDEVWGIGRKWSDKLNIYGYDTVGKFIGMDDNNIKKWTNINGLKTKMEILGMYCHPIENKIKQKKVLASTRSFGSDVNSFDQICEAMHYYIERGVKRLTDAHITPNSATIFLSGNRYKDNHHSSVYITFNRQTKDIKEIWSQVYVHLRELYDDEKVYKKCGIIFNKLFPEDIEQINLFEQEFMEIEAPKNEIKMWAMRQDYLSKKYTSSWDEIPVIRF